MHCVIRHIFFQKLHSLSRERKNLSQVLEEEGNPSSPPPISISFYAFRFMISFLLVFSLLERTLISLRLSLDQLGPPNINNCIPPLSSGTFTVVDRPLSSTTGRIYGVFKIDSLKPQSTLLHQFSADMCSFSSITSNPTFRRLALHSFLASTC